MINCMRACALFNIFNGLERIFLTFGGKSMQGWIAKTGPKLQSIEKTEMSL